MPASRNLLEIIVYMLIPLAVGMSVDHFPCQQKDFFPLDDPYQPGGAGVFGCGFFDNRSN